MTDDDLDVAYAVIVAALVGSVVWGYIILPVVAALVEAMT